LSVSVYETGGRTSAVHPDTQIVDRMVAWRTAGFVTPGVRQRLGRTATARGPVFGAAVVVVVVVVAVVTAVVVD
jgi:hypothetical protein